MGAYTWRQPVVLYVVMGFQAVKTVWLVIKSVLLQI